MKRSERHDEHQRETQVEHVAEVRLTQVLAAVVGRLLQNAFSSRAPGAP